MTRGLAARAALSALCLLALPGTAHPDWQVRREGPQALVDRAERALQERPDDDVVARRLAGLAKAAQRQAVLARFRARAQSATSYGPKAAYARLLLATGDATGAAAAFTEALRTSPRALPALVGRARALAATGAVAESLAIYDDALSLERQPAARRRLIEAALALLEARRGDERGTRDVDRQVALRRELLTLDPDGDGAARRLADALEAAGRVAEAADVLEARVPAGRASSKLDLALHAARLRLQTGVDSQTTRVAATLDGLLRDLPRGDAERRREVWALALSTARKRGTLPDIARTIEKLADRAGVGEYEVLGQVRDELGDLEGALGALRAAEGLAPRDPELARRIISLLDRLGRDEDATQACEALTRRMPTDPRPVIDLVDRQMRRGRRDEAGAALDQALVRFARDRASLTELAFAASRWGDQARALAAWQRLRRIDPKNEVAIIGLGEAEFQRGHKEEAKRIWAALRDAARGSAAGHLRLAEVLLDHDLGAEAASEARRAQTLDPRAVATHRLLARIFERDRKIEDAITEWNIVLELAGSHKATDEARSRDEHVALRREARVRLLALYGRQGRGRLNAQIRKLADEVKARPGDAEIALYLAEAQERAGDAAGAAATLQALLARLPADSGPGHSPRDGMSIDATLALVQLLKRTGRVDEAIERLDTLARLAPNRAREAHLQIADIALARYDTARALEHADKAAAGADGPMLARIAEIEARAGADKSALASYRRAVAQGAGPQTELAWAKALARDGDEPAAVVLLDRLLAASSDEDILSDAGRIAVDLGELRGRLPELQRKLADDIGTAPRPLAHRRALIAVLKRLLPPLYRDPAADVERLRVGRQVLRPLLDAITDAEQVPDRDAVELLGMLGNGDAAPALSRVALRPRESAPARPRSRTVEPTVTAETQLAAVIALGRLQDTRGRAALERLAATADPALRAAAVWSLGRLSDERGRSVVLGALSDRRPEVVLAACLALGRAGDERAAVALSRAASDAGQPTSVRIAAIVGLGRTRQRTATSLLFELMDSGDEALSRAAALALAASADPRATSGLLLRALLPRQFALVDASAPLAALDAARAGVPLLDDARRPIPTAADIETLLPVPPPSSRADLAAVLRLHTHELQDAIGHALTAGGEAGRDVLGALDGRSDALALGALTEDRASRSASDVATIVRDIVQPQADKLVALLDDADSYVRATALRVLTKLGDERATPGRVALALAASDKSPQLAAAVAFATGKIVRDRPETIPGFVNALSPFLGDDSWRRRLATVEALATLGPAGRPAIERARTDRSPLVRASAVAILAGHGPIDLLGAPSTMP